MWDECLLVHKTVIPMFFFGSLFHSASLRFCDVDFLYPCKNQRVENSIAPLEVRIKNLVLSKVKLSHSVTCFYNFYYVTFIWVFIGLIVPTKRRMMTRFCSSDVKQSKTNPEHNRWTPFLLLLCPKNWNMGDLRNIFLIHTVYRLSLSNDRF